MRLTRPPPLCGGIGARPRPPDRCASSAGSATRRGATRISHFTHHAGPAVLDHRRAHMNAEAEVEAFQIVQFVAINRDAADEGDAPPMFKAIGGLLRPAATIEGKSAAVVSCHGLFNRRARQGVFDLADFAVAKFPDPIVRRRQVRAVPGGLVADHFSLRSVHGRLSRGRALHITYHKRNCASGMVTMDEQISGVLDFWFDGVVEGEMRPEWWEQSDEFDAQIRGQFGEMHKRAAAGEFDHWAETEKARWPSLLSSISSRGISTAAAPRPSLTIRKRSRSPRWPLRKAGISNFKNPTRFSSICHTSTAKTLRYSAAA